MRVAGAESSTPRRRCRALHRGVEDSAPATPWLPADAKGLLVEYLDGVPTEVGRNVPVHGPRVTLVHTGPDDGQKSPYRCRMGRSEALPAQVSLRQTKRSEFRNLFLTDSRPRFRQRAQETPSGEPIGDRSASRLRLPAK